MSSPAVSRHRLVDRPRIRRPRPRAATPAPPARTASAPPASPAGTATTGAAAPGGGRRRCSPCTACRRVAAAGHRGLPAVPAPRGPRAGARGHLRRVRHRPGLRPGDAHRPGGRPRSGTSSSWVSAARTTTATVTAVEGMAVDITECHPPGSPTERAQALEAEVGQLRAAMASRAAIEQAKGILMLLTSCSDQVAFDLLAHISSHTHRKVRDVAQVITESAAGRTRLPGRHPGDHPRRLPAGPAPPVAAPLPGSRAAGPFGRMPLPPADASVCAGTEARGGEARRALPHRPVRPATDVPDPSGRPSPAGRTCRPPARSSSPATTCPSSTASPSRSWPPGGSATWPRPSTSPAPASAGWLTPHAVHRPGRAAGRAARPTAPPRRRSTPP